MLHDTAIGHLSYSEDLKLKYLAKMLIIPTSISYHLIGYKCILTGTVNVNQVCTMYLAHFLGTKNKDII